MDGAPELDRSSRYAPWARVLGREYEQLRADAVAGRPTFLNQYGATSPAEFFAVITEAFFEQPREFKERHGELYAQLVTFYRQDPGRRS